MQMLTGGHLDACLVHIYPSGPAMGRRYALGKNTWLLGRGEDCDIRVNENSVYRKHAKIDPSPTGYIVNDLGSTNGTFVNDVVTGGNYLLRDGDYLRVGNCAELEQVFVVLELLADPSYPRGNRDATRNPPGGAGLRRDL